MTSRRPPASGSDAATFYALDIGDAQRVRRRLGADAPTSQSIGYEICPQFGGVLDSQSHRSVLALSIDAVFELRVVTRGPIGRDGCALLTLNAEKSMIATQLSRADTAVLMLLPIRSVYSLFTDSEGTLRYVGHAGASNIENQPVLSELASLRLSSASDAATGLTELHASIGCGSQGVLEISMLHALGRESPMNLLLNTTRLAPVRLKAGSSS